MNDTFNSLFAAHINDSVQQFLPETVLTILMVLVIIFDVVYSRTTKLKTEPNENPNKINLTAWFTIIGFLVTATFLFNFWTDGSTEKVAFAGTLINDAFATFFKIIILGGALITVLMTLNSDELKKSENSIGEFYILLIAMVLGMFLLVSANNLLMIYIAFETMSLSSYILAGYTKEVCRSSEASLKYVIYGSVASGVMIFGISLLFGLTGSFDLTEINQQLSMLSTGNELALATSIILIFAGIAYKISAVPFHFWTPDVYEGAPIPTTALLSVVSKAAGFALMIRFFITGLSQDIIDIDHIWNSATTFDWAYMIGIVSVLTMTIGNAIALWQNNMKRMLAYSSIAHCGYMLLGVMVMNSAGIEALMFYFITYLLMNFGAFLVIQLISNKKQTEDVNQYDGLGYQNPFIALALLVFLLSLMGMPPLAGFIAKWYLFTAVLDAGYTNFAIIGVLNSVVAVFYYVKPLRNMYIRNTDTTEKIKFGKTNMVFVYCFVIPVVLLFINFEPLILWVKASISILK